MILDLWVFKVSWLDYSDWMMVFTDFGMCGLSWASFEKESKNREPFGFRLGVGLWGSIAFV